jgi:hypothetical protein
MPRWRHPAVRWNHYVDHGRALGVRTVDQYDQSAVETITAGRRFTYNDPSTGLPRVGYYDHPTRRFVGLSDDEVIIVTHFVTHEGYVRALPNSTY